MVVLVIKVEPTHHNPYADTFCDWTLYNVANWMLMTPIIIFIVTFCGLCCYSCAAAVTEVKSNSSSDETTTIEVSSDENVRQNDDHNDTSIDEDEKIKFDVDHVG